MNYPNNMDMEPVTSSNSPKNLLFKFEWVEFAKATF